MKLLTLPAAQQSIPCRGAPAFQGRRCSAGHGLRRGWYAASTGITHPVFLASQEQSPLYALLSLMGHSDNNYPPKGTQRREPCPLAQPWGMAQEEGAHHPCHLLPSPAQTWGYRGFSRDIPTGTQARTHLPLTPCATGGRAPRAVRAVGAPRAAPGAAPSLPSRLARSIADPQASDAVLRAVAATLRSYPFDFRGAKILSGEEEGVFGWVTANYLLENFIKVGRGARHLPGTAVVAWLSCSSSHPCAPSCLPCSAWVARGMDPASEEDTGSHGLWGRFHTDHL